MSISRLTGQMLQSTLLRDGIGLSFQDTSGSNSTLYLDVANTRVGINTQLPAANLDVKGNILADNLIANISVRSVNGYFSGNVEVIGNLITTGNAVIYANSGIFYGNTDTGNSAIYGGLPGFTPLGSNVVIQFAGNANSYSQVNFQNISDGTSASTDYIATADNGTDTTYYIDVGINSSTFDDPVNYPGFSPNDSYVHNHGGNLIINPETEGTVIKFMVGGTANADVIGTISNTALSITGEISATGNISTTANASIGNISVGTIDATGNITASAINANVYGNLTGNVDVYDVVASNAVITPTVTSTGVLNITSQASGNILIDAAGVTRVVGTDAFYVPVGNILERPVAPEQGAMRFNTTTSSLEVWDGSEWDAATNDMSIITNQTINPNGSTDTFTLDRSTTAEAIIITINGLNQTPDDDYTVVGDQVTFTTTPIETDTIQVRFIASTATITGIVNVNSYVTIGTPSGNVDIAANGVQSGTFTETGLVVSSLTASANVQLPVYTVAEAGNITGNAGQVIYVSNGDSGSPCLAVYSAGDWKRIALGATIST